MLAINSDSINLKCATSIGRQLFITSDGGTIALDWVKVHTGRASFTTVSLCVSATLSAVCFFILNPKLDHLRDLVF